MIVLSIICGIILVVAGFTCIFSPLGTFLASGYLVAILLLIYGIVGIVNVVKKKVHPAMLIVYILGIIVGIVSIFRPGAPLVIDAVMVYVFAAWFVVQGIISIYVSIVSRHDNRGWVFGLIIGIIGVLLGIFSFFNPMISAVAIGLLIGIYLIEAGISLMVFSTAVEAADDVSEQ